MSKRIIGSNSHGFRNEENIVQALNNYKLKDLNSNLKKFIKDICNDNNIVFSDELIIKSELETNNKLKQDFYIIINDITFGISMKMGTGNSVHQEKIESFINWASNKLKDGISEEIKNDLRLFIWGDGSYDGQAPKVFSKDGKIIGRFGCTEFKKLYPKQREKLQEFLDNNMDVIFSRAIFEGKNGSKVDYIYHGTHLNGVWISKKEIIQFNKNNNNVDNTKRAPALTVGRLSVQPWNPSLKGTKEDRRGQIQLKYSSMVKDFEYLMLIKSSNVGTFEGDKEEFNLSKILNKEKKHKFWKVLSEYCDLGEDIEDYYIVKVEGNKKSNLINKKVKCKADEFIIKSKLDRNYLLQCEYQITENMLKKIEKYEVIDNSGISVKRADSRSYTIIKLTDKTFKEAFKKYIKDIEFILAGLIIYSNKNKLSINKKILNDLKVDEIKLINYFLKEYGINHKDSLDEEVACKISKKSKEIVKEAIERNAELKASLFSGKEWFENPYFINFIFKNGELTTNIYTDYYISNGSGRSKGKYTIILKPEKK